MFFNNGKKEKEQLEKRVVELETEIEHLKDDLIHDPMTGLKTKGFFEEECSLCLSILENRESSSRKENSGFKNLSLIFFDLDFFKTVNDTYGHQKGDVALIETARTIAENFRDEDTVARWGGEEFVVLLLGAGEEDAKRKANEVRERIGEMSFDFDRKLKLTTSAGVASASGGMGYDELLKRADEALYKAKSTGRDRVVAYSEMGSA
ncbi:MAG: GGDEF domain-containing protein [Patescibacteria group bacterium]